MDISGSYTLYAPRERVWAALLDPDMLKQTIPGCERLDKESEDTFLLRLNIGVASVKGIYDGTLRLSDLHPPERYHMTVDGKGARGVLHGDGTLSLEPRDPNTTVVSYSGQAQLGGPIAGVGMRVASGAANMLIKAYFSRLADLLAERAPVAASVSTAADVLPEEVVDSPLEGPPPVQAAADAAPARVATPIASARPPAVNLPERGPLMRLVRRAGLSDGSIESERRWARGIIGALLLVAAGIVLIAVLAGRSERRERV
ncbi:MAG TPA: carbon monoxide dehydrogenase subunit G [Ktedonobacterales bacterium]